MVNVKAILFSFFMAIPITVSISSQDVPKIETIYYNLVKSISSTYGVGEKFVLEVVKLAIKHQDPVFPKANDILAIVSVESGWNPKAKSGPKSDPNIGLTQIKPKQWKKRFGNRDYKKVETQIQTAAEILKFQYKLTKSKKGAILAYNAGYGNYKNGVYETAYYDKVSEKKQWLNSLNSTKNKRG